MNEYFQSYPIKSTEHGKVLVNFTVGRTGEIKDIIIKDSSNDKLNDLVLKMLSDMPFWQPACDAGKIIEVVLSIPITF